MRNHTHKQQQGVALIIALIALAALSLAGVAMMRSVDTSNVIAGNIAFNEAAIQVANVGAELAYIDIENNKFNDPTQSGCPFGAANCPKNQAGSSYFYPNYSALDTTSKLPTGAPDWSDPVPVPLTGESATTASYKVQYVIERMCTGTANGQEVATFAKCRAAPLYSAGTVLPGEGKIFYRITVQSFGPRNTKGTVQYFYGVQDTVN